MTISIFFLQLLENHININKGPCINSMGWSNTVGVIQILFFFPDFIRFYYPNHIITSKYSKNEFPFLKEICSQWSYQYNMILSFAIQWTLKFVNQLNSEIYKKIGFNEYWKKKPQFQRETISTIRHGLKQFIKHSH